MADFVTKKENTRRMATLIVCALISATALLFGLLAVKKTRDLEKREDNPKRIVKLRTEVSELRAQNDKKEQDLLAFGQSIGWSSQATGTLSRFATDPVNAPQMERYLSDWAMELKKLGVTKYKRWEDPGAGENLSLTQLLDELLTKEREYQAKILSLMEDLKQQRAAEKAVIDDIEKLSTQLKTEIDGGVAPEQPATGLIGELIGLMKAFNALQKQHTTEMEAAEIDTRAKQEEATVTKNDNLRKRTAGEYVKAELKKRIYSITFKREQALELREPDGMILSVNQDLKLCYIDLLHKDRLFKGTKFYVYSLEKGGVKVDKGLIEVISVRKEPSSVCAILKTDNPDMKIAAGDRIYNEFYEGGKPRYIAFAGRFTGALSNEEAVAAIRSFGDFFQDKVDDKTNYLVVSEGYEDHPNYKAAQDFSVKILLERYLYDYLGVKK